MIVGTVGASTQSLEGASTCQENLREPSGFSRPYTRVCNFGCLKGVQSQFRYCLLGIEAVMVLTLVILKQRALCI